MEEKGDGMTWLDSAFSFVVFPSGWLRFQELDSSENIIKKIK